MMSHPSPAAAVTAADGRTTSLARRVSLLGSAAVALMLLLICVAMSLMITQRSREQVFVQAADKAEALVDAVEAFDQSQRVLVQRFFKPFKAGFADALVLDEAAGRLSSGGTVLNDRFDEVDRFERDTGGVATVFMRRGDDFVRIATSVKKEDGSRAMGTALDRAHPAYAEITAGRAYEGRAQLFGRHFMTRYEPARDATGRIVGILFIGFDLSGFQASMAQLTAHARFFDSGGLYVVAPARGSTPARFVFHPAAAGKAVAEAVPAGGEALVQRLADAGEAPLREVTPALAAADSSAGERWAVVRKSPSTGWWIVAEVSDDEAMAGHWATLRPFWLLLAGATVVLGFGLNWMLRRSVAQPLGELTAAFHRVAGGDLSQPMHSTRRDEVGALIREVEAMRRRLAGLLGQVRAATDSIGTASSEIAQGNTDLSVRTEQAASSLQQTASSMEQLTGTVRSSADAAATAKRLSGEAAAQAQRGGEAVGNVVATMTEINTASRRIADIISTIDGIAFQTNILALNAAVEAARAGEAGRGFAVVAGEVRNLAQRAAGAAREIKALISDSVRSADNGHQLVQDAGATMAQIVASVQRVSDIIGEISASASEQSSGIGQVNIAVTELDRVTQQNAALVEQSAAAAQSLKEQAQGLAGVMAGFRLDSRG